MFALVEVGSCEGGRRFGRRCNVPGRAGKVQVVDELDDGGAAFESMFRANYDDLLRFAYRRVDPDSAVDVIAEVFLVAWRRRRQVPSGAERLWLFRTAANLIANERRGVSRWLRLIGRASAQPVEVAADPGEFVPVGLHVRAALATLPVREQEALRLTEWEQLDIGEAAQVARCSPATFRVRLHRARRRLATRLAEIDPQPRRSGSTATSVEDVIR
jgi:RNA polymerase sigma-70 factor (ECF subfamily)